MLGVLLIYVIGRIFFDLATIFQKSKWAYAILGILSYYFGTVAVGVVIAIYYELYSEQSIEDVSDLMITFMAFPFGLLSCYLFYTILKNTWAQEGKSVNEDILDDDLRNGE